MLNRLAALSLAVICAGSVLMPGMTGSSIVCGDVNGDGSFSIADAVLFQKWLLGVPGTELSDWKQADFCTDDNLDVFDLTLMKKALLTETPPDPTDPVTSRPPGQLSVAGRYFVVEDETHGDYREFYFGEDGTYSYDPGRYLSNVGHGTWVTDGDTIIMTEYKYGEVNRLRIENNFLVYVAEGSDGFRYGAVEDGACFWITAKTYDQFGDMLGNRVFSLTPSRNGVDEFLAREDAPEKQYYPDDELWNVTPEEISDGFGWRIFKYAQSCETYLEYMGKVYQLGTGFGGAGTVSFAMADLNNDKLFELYFTFSCGSGMHRSQIGRFDPKTKTVSVCDITFWENDMTFMLGSDGKTIEVYRAEISTNGSFADVETVPKEKIGVLYRYDEDMMFKPDNRSDSRFVLNEKEQMIQKHPPQN